MSIVSSNPASEPVRGRVIGEIQLPDGAGPFTFAWWHNCYKPGCAGKSAACVAGQCLKCGTGGWAKVLSFAGTFESQYPVGTKRQRPARNVLATHTHGGGQLPRSGDEHQHQPAIILGKRYGYLCPDVDDAELYASEALLAKLVTRDMAISTRGDHWHALGWVPEELRHLWPDKGVPGADLKGAADGFIPVPGSYHYSGARYEAPPVARVFTWTEEMLRAVQDQPVTEKARAAGYTGGSANGRQGDLQRGLMKFSADAEDEARAWYAEEFVEAVGAGLR
jgi:hypothetical protein